MTLIEPRVLRVLLTGTLYICALALVYFAYPALVAIIFAFLFAYILQPIVKVIESRVWHSRAFAIVVAYVVFSVVGAGVWILLGHRLGREVRTLQSSGAEVWKDVRGGQIPPVLRTKAQPLAQIEQQVIHWASENQNRIQRWTQEAMRYSASLAIISFWAIVVLVLGIFVLKDKDRWLAALSREPEAPKNRQRVHRMLVEIDRAVARYIWAQVMLSAIAFGVFVLVLSVLRLPSAILLAFRQGVLEFIFVFGPLVAGIIILAVALFTGHSPLATLIFLIAWRIVQDYVNTPLLFGKRLEMHPLMVVIVLMIGWNIGNIVGMFLAVPIVAAGQIVWETWAADVNPGKKLAALFEIRNAA